MPAFDIQKTSDGYQKVYQPTYDPNCEETGWFRVFSLWPRSCEVTGESLFFKPAYCKRRKMSFRDGIDVETIWHSEQGHTLYLLKSKN